MPFMASLKALRTRFRPRPARTPTILQMEATECGAACLGMVLGYFGKFVPLPELNRQCGVSRDGSKASKVVAAARHYGLHAKGYSKSGLAALLPLPLPMIVFWQFNHFVVVEGFDDRFVYLNDPACGHRKVTHGEFSDAFTGVVLTVTPGPEFEKGGRMPALLPAVAKRLQGGLQPILYCLCAGGLLVLPNLAMPIFANVFIDKILLDGHTTWIRPLLAIMAVALAMQVALKALELHYLRRVRIALTTRFSSQFFWHLLRLPVSYYAQRYPGEVAWRSHLNPQVANALSGELAVALIQLCTMVLYLSVMFYYDALLTWIGIGFAALNFAVLRMVSAKRIEANMRVAQDTGMAATVAMAGLQSIETIKASGMENGFFAKWAGHYAKGSVAYQEQQQVSLAMGVLPVLLSGVGSTLILVVGGLRVMNGYMTIGMLVAFQQLLRSFLAPVGELVDLGGRLQELQANLLRLDDVLDNKADPLRLLPDEAELAQAKGNLRLEGWIELRDVSFGYSPLEPPLIADFQLRVEPGQRVALVGGSGSGKSTLSKLITGLYQPWEGEILFDGRPRTEIRRPVLVNSVGFVDQDILLFEGTIRDNLTLWDQSIPEETLVRACMDAAIYDDVASLPGGLDARLQEGGTNLSGGQRQRLEIARALVNNPSILVLDEATSALDAETEHAIDENLRRRGCTCVLVAHRLSTIRDCDEIVVMNRGRILERGTHQQLWQAQGAYAQLIRVDDEQAERETQPTATSA